MYPWGQSHVTNLALCGCWYVLPTHSHEKRYLPQIELDSKTTILSCTARTKLVQTFTNTESTDIPEAQYTFPLYDGVSVVSFKCTVGERTIFGVVKEKQQARTDYKEAIDRGETAGLLEQFEEAGDIFTTKIGNIPAAGKVTVEIVYLGELKHDAEVDGIRFTIPTAIAPRYGSMSKDSHDAMFGLNNVYKTNGIKILVDVAVEEGSNIRQLQSPSHPIAVTLGRNSTHDEEFFQNNLASATLALSGKTELDQDFVVIVKAQGQDTPRAFLETHDALPNQRALMTTLVPKFDLPSASPEIVFVVDRSGSMSGKIPLVVQALRIFLKSLPTSVKFNICSFGSRYSFLFKKSRPYDESSLNEALQHLESFKADYGGTEMLAPVKECVKQRLKGTSLEVMMLTDGEIWNQNELFDFINDAAKDRVRVFSLGIGSGASSSLVEGIARAGNGFAQFVYDGEQIDKRVVRMLKAALMPFVSDYSVEVVYGAEEDTDDDDGFTLVESFSESMKIVVEGIEAEGKKQSEKKPISLFNINFKEKKPTDETKGRFDHLPSVSVPKILQAPHKIPQLYPFTRTTIYLLFGPNSCQRRPQKVVLRGTSEHGPLELEIPIQDLGKGEMVHQLGARKAVQDLEEGRGWISEAKTSKGKLLKDKFESDWERIAEREAVRIGTEFQVAGKFCSFVAVEANSQSETMEVSTKLDKAAAPLNLSAPSGALDQQAVHGNKSYLMKSKKSAHDGARGGARKAILFGAGGSFFGSAPAHSPAPGGALFGSSMVAHTPTIRQRSAARAPTADLSFGSVAPAPAVFGIPDSSPGAPMPPPPASPAYSLVSPQKNETMKLSEERSDRENRRSSRRQEVLFDEDESSLGEAAQDSLMHAIIGLQEFNGSWKKVNDLLDLIGISRETFDSVLKDVQSDTVKATALAVAWFETRAITDKETWEMVADKARSWIAGQGASDANAVIISAKLEFLP